MWYVRPKWSVDEVTEYISTLKLNEQHQYNEEAPSFRKELVNGRMLLKLQKDDLNVLGVDHFSKRNALFDHIQKLRVSPSKKCSPSKRLSPSKRVTPSQKVSASTSSNLSIPSQCHSETSVSASSQSAFSIQSKNRALDIDQRIFLILNQIEMSIDPKDDDIVHFAGILSGFQMNSSGSTVTVLMTQSDCNKLNEHFQRKKIKNRERDTFSVSQEFGCYIPVERVPFGWSVKGQPKWPFNALIRCKWNVVNDEVIDMEPVTVSGSINHVNGSGETWLMSDVVVDAVERVPSKSNEDRRNSMISNIVSLKLSNDLDASVQHRNSSYLLHDPDARPQRHFEPDQWTKGLRLRFNLKLSGRTNQRARSSIRPRFVQCWNVKSLEL